MATVISWDNFALGQADLGEDTIRLTESNLNDPNLIEIVLSTDQQVTWWKGIELWDGVIGASNKIGFTYTQDSNHGPVCAQVRANSPERFRLELLKGKMFNVHTGMYELRDFSLRRGRRLHFHWIRD
ncbi:MAG TPA: hypothetical protein DCP31_18770 [Cyanobacteria bacterium UBA8543]|nr:hypothetical protein [Cyanobacteria bacterium UBA8543]